MMRRFPQWAFAFAVALAGPIRAVVYGQVVSVTTTGTVFGPAGAPAAGVSLTLVPGYGANNAEIQSDAGGKYSLTWQRPNFGGGQMQMIPFIMARDPAHDLAVSHDLDDTTTNLDLRLQPGLTLAVKVQDARGRPIPTATETLVVFAGNQGVVLNQAPATADAQGLIEIKDLPQERRYVATILAPGYGSANAQTLAGDTQTTRFEFPAAMLRAADLKLAGQVLGPDNKPVSGANVNVQPIEGQPIANTTTDAQGHFAFAAVCEGTVRLSANTQGGPNYMYANAQAQAGDTNALIRLLANGQAMPANARMVTTSGTVFDPDGTPVSGVRLSVMPAFGMNAEVRSDAAGKYSITWQARIAGARAGAAAPGGAAAIPAIQYLLLARDQEHRLASAVDLDEKATNVDVHLQAALTISGFVIDPGGAPVTNAMIGILLRAGNNASSILLQQPVTVDALGAFSITPLPQSQRYTLTAKATGYGTDTRRLAAAETETTSLQLPPFTLKVANLKLQGRVVDADDKPVSGARVSVIGTGQPVDTTTTDSNGHFLCQHVCEGPLQVFASGQPAINGSASVQAQGGDMDVVVKVGVDATGSRIIRQAAPRTAPLKPPPWSWTAFSQWPAQHPKVMVVLLGAQVTALLGTAGGLFWLARKRRV